MKSLEKNVPVSAAILVGSLLISLSILISGGIIRLKNISSPSSTAVIPQAPVAAQPTQAPIQLAPLTDSDHVRGNRNARIILFEYSDLECPFCKRFHPTAQQAVDQYNGQLAWVYRHFPLDQLHSKARKEAEAAECANEIAGNDGFWRMVDKIYEVTPSNNGLNLDDLSKLASQVGLDPVRFKSCFDSGKYSQLVESDYQSGIKAGVQGTPGNILYDTKTSKTTVLPGAVPWETAKAAVDAFLK